AIEVSMGHGIGTATVACSVWYWSKSFGSFSPRRWFLVGMLFGIAAMVRWQLVTLVLLPAGEAAWALATLERRHRQAICQQALSWGGLVLGMTIGFLPQLIAWRVVYGHWWASPITVSHNWLRPALEQVLLTRDRGFF